MKSLSKNFFILSFIPATAYWYLEANYPVRVALLGGLLLAFIELSFEWFFCKKLHTLSKVNFYLILFLGGISLLGDDGIWFKLQPAFSGICIGGFLTYKWLKDESLMYEMMISLNTKNPAPEFIVKMLEKHVSIFFILYGLFMGAVAFTFSTDVWIFFKTLGFYLIFFIFFIFEVIYMRILIRKVEKNNYSRMILNSMRQSNDI